MPNAAAMGAAAAAAQQVSPDIGHWVCVGPKLGAFPSLAHQVQQLTNMQQGNPHYHSIGQDALQQQQQLLT
jgi:hypothetical protein